MAKKILFSLILLVLVSFSFSGCLMNAVINSFKDSVEAGYYKNFDTEADLEKYYSVPGSFAVSTWSKKVSDSSIKKLEIWYPSDLEESSEKYPLIISVNASNTPASKYDAYLEKLASWGFIVVGNEDKQTGNGTTASKTLDLILSISSDCPVYGKIDESNIGILGGSQGGAGAICAATKFNNSSKYKTLVTISAAYPLLAKNMGWEYDASKISVPTFMMAGTGSSDDSGNYKDDEFAGVSPLFALVDNYNDITAAVPKVRGRIIGAEHQDMLVESDPYVTAWFMYQLQNDAKAETVFFGDNAEILSNNRWQDVKCEK